MTGLRDYQQRVLDEIGERLRIGMRRLILVAPTGSGKSLCAAELIRRALDATRRVLFLVHQRELLQQASRHLHRTGIDHGLIAAGFNARPHELVQVGMIPTLHARAIRTNQLDLPPADLILIDECHHAAAGTWTKLIAGYPDTDIVGLTATPCRTDGRGLGNIFDAMVECPDVAELTKAGWLVPTKVYAPSAPDLAGIRTTAGDYNRHQLGQRMDQPQLVGDIVQHWLRLSERRKTVVFAASVPHSHHLADEFGRVGVSAAHLDGMTPLEERDRILKQLATGALDVVCNYGVLTEGYDLPDMGCVIVARPTKSFGLYRQMVGRGLRPAEGKGNVIVLDHAGVTQMHGFIDEPVEWALTQDEKLRRPQFSNKPAMMRKLTECPECNAVRWSGSACTACGWHPRARSEAVDVVNGELVEFSRDGSKPLKPQWSKQEFYSQLLWVAQTRGYKPGWAAWKYKERFQMWPMGLAKKPAAASPEMLSWIRSRQIAYAKSQQQSAA